MQPYVLKIWPRAALDKQQGRMRPAGRQFDMPELECQYKVSLFFLFFIKGQKKTLFEVVDCFEFVTYDEKGTTEM